MTVIVKAAVDDILWQRGRKHEKIRKWVGNGIE